MFRPRLIVQRLTLQDQVGFVSRIAPSHASQREAYAQCRKTGHFG
jgi:hypothetical protein